MNRRTLLFAVLVGLASTACGGALMPAPADPAWDERSERQEIVELSVRFADAVNRHDWEAMALMCTEDAVWEAAAGEIGFRHEGRAAIRKFLVENPNGVEVLAYATTMPFIEAVSKDRARTRLSMAEYLRIRATGQTKRIVGVYSDDLIKRDGRWQFSRRRFTLQAAFDQEPAAL